MSPEDFFLRDPEIDSEENFPDRAIVLTRSVNPKRSVKEFKNNKQELQKELLEKSGRNSWKNPKNNSSFLRGMQEEVPERILENLENSGDNPFQKEFLEENPEDVLVEIAN